MCVCTCMCLCECAYVRAGTAGGATHSAAAAAAHSTIAAAANATGPLARPLENNSRPATQPLASAFRARRHALLAAAVRCLA